MFWIGLVALLMPHAGGVEISGVPTSSGNTPVATAAISFQDVLLQRLTLVKADIESAESSRAGSSDRMIRQH
jgi:hypothetical protein